MPENRASMAKPCPICGHPAEPQFRPFCSRRCKDVDLHRWLSDVYTLQGDGAEAETDEEVPSPRLAPDHY
jgi:endogenous inhibitor of DNA gyrase (YacG/DUF329 family)